MKLASISAVDEEQISDARAAHPGSFLTPFDEVKKFAPWVSAIAYVIGSLIYFDIARLLEASERVLRLLRAMVVWEDMATWQYANIYTGIAQTLAMAFLGTLMGTIGSLFVGFLAAKNVNPSGFLRQIVRRFLDILRGIDQLVWGLVFVRAVGLGPLAGVLAIFISDLGTLSKLYSEAIENIDRKQVEGVRATGAGPLAVIRYGYLPQVLPVFISQSLYFWESNTRSATILGIVGAGGIGYDLRNTMSWGQGRFDEAAAIFLLLFASIVVVDQISSSLRNRLTYGARQQERR